jgi:hypothetical protein
MLGTKSKALEHRGRDVKGSDRRSAFKRL